MQNMHEDSYPGEGTGNGEWGRRRKHLRHDVDVRGRILGAGNEVIDCRIHDLSSSGMLLGYEVLVPEGGREPLREGSSVRLRFAPDADRAPDYFIDIDVQIMWRTPHGVGVRFLELDQEQRRALRSLAAAAVARRRREQEEASRRGARAPAYNKAKVMSDCRKTLERHLPNMLWTLRTEVQRRLRQSAVDSPEQREEALAEVAVLESKANAIGRSVERQLMLAVAELSGLDSTQELVFTGTGSRVVAAATGAGAGASGRGSAEMDMVDSERVASTAALAATVQYIEDQLKSRAFELNVRLANVLAQKLDTQTNPMLPARLCRTLWEAISEHADNARIHRCLREVFRVRLLPLLSDLYGDLHKTLDRHDVPGAFRHDR